MKLATWVQILDKAICLSLCDNALEKGMNPSVFPPPMGVIVEQTGFFMVVMLFKISLSIIEMERLRNWKWSQFYFCFADDNNWNPIEWDRAAEELTWERVRNFFFFFDKEN